MKSLLTIATVAFAFGVPFAQDTLAPGENLVLDSIPPVSKSLVAEVDRYTDYRGSAFSSWHPAERHMLINTRFENSPQIHLVKQPGGDRHQLTFFDEPVGGASFHPVDGAYFVFSRDAGGDEFYQNYRFDLDTRRATLITDGEKRNATGEWSEDGAKYAYDRVDANDKGAFTEIHVVDPAAPDSDRVVAKVDGGGWGILDWSPDNRFVLAMEYISINETYLWLIDTAEQGQKLITAEKSGETVAYGAGQFAGSGEGLFVTTDAGSEFRQFAHLDIESGERTSITPDISWDVDEMAVSPDGKFVAFEVNEAGVSSLYLYHTVTKKRTKIPGVPVGVAGGLSWHNNGEDVAFSLSSAKSPGDVYSYGVHSKKLERWTESESAVPTDQFPDAELISWKSFDDLEITGFLYRPPAKFTGKRPVIINIHGGPEGQSRPAFLGRSNYFLNELGVAMIFPNVRGSTGYGKTFVQLDNGLKREDSYKDINALFDWIAKQPTLDASKVMVTGGSYGGFMTLAVATNYNDRIACSVDVVGISNLRTFLENTQGYRRDLRRAEYGDERDSEMRAFQDRIAPMAKAKNITKPIFVVQGLNDPRVPKSEADQMVKTLHENGTGVWYLVANDEGHGFRKKNNADFQFYATVMFVKEHLM